MGKNKQSIIEGIIIGTVAGAALGIFLWVIEKFTREMVYTLLMNVDFIPLLGGVQLPSIMEWLFHLIISWGISMIFVFFVRGGRFATKLRKWLLVLFLATVAGLSYFPLTILAKTETPSFFDFEAIFYWTAGHILFAVLLKKTYDVIENPHYK